MVAVSMTTLSNSMPVGATPVPVVGGDVPDYFALLKPRVMVLVIFTALVGMVVSHGHVPPAVAVISLLMIAIGAGAVSLHI